MNENYGYHEDHRNGDDIIRARTAFGQLRSWRVPRKLRALGVLNKEFGEADFPGVYILFHKNKKEVYVGEAKSLYNRLKTHITAPEEKIKEWNRVLVINDGRPATQSDFNDTVIRRSMEYYLIKLLKVNRYSVLAQGEFQRHNPQQRAIIEQLLDELNYFLQKQGIITRLLEKKKEELVLSDELFSLLRSKGHTVDEEGEKFAIVNGKKAFIRPGSKKAKGWQVTIRGKKSGGFIDSFQMGSGYLLMPRGGILLIPLKQVQKIVDKTTMDEIKTNQRDTVDVFVNFKEDGIELIYKSNILDITRFKVVD